MEKKSGQGEVWQATTVQLCWTKCGGQERQTSRGWTYVLGEHRGPCDVICMFSKQHLKCDSKLSVGFSSVKASVCCSLQPQEQSQQP